ncbi:MAG: aldehyde dehydrogenase family protein [Haloferacaceae archaeon]
MAQQDTSRYRTDGDWAYCYVDGERERAADREQISVTNPATGDQIATVPAATEADVDRAFEAAATAQPAWAARPPQERAGVVQRALELLEEHGDAIRETLITEGGSTHLKASLETEELAPGMMAEAVSFPGRAQGRHADSVVPGKENEVRREPVGIVGIISPWNFPFHLSMRAVAPAIALGNAVVLKPSSETPISGGLAIAQLFEDAGLPDGVLNVVPGPGSTTGERVASHPDLDVLAFTGSTGVGRHVAALAAAVPAMPALELGGNNPHVVLSDADLKRALDAGVFASFMHQGQVCISINRHLVHESLYDEYVERLAARAAELTVGDPADPETDVGPIISDEQAEEMMEYVEETVEKGATVETGGEADGRFVEPTVLSDVGNDMAAACNEHFGPIAPVIPFADDREAVELANDTEYGLAASVHSTDLERARSVAEQIEAGMVHINDQPLNDEPHIPFGGVKASGLGRYNADAIMHELTETKWISTQHEPREFPL